MNNASKPKNSLGLLTGILVVSLLLFSLGLLSQSLRYIGDSSKGFVLPEGDAVQGKTAFTELGCVRCHTVDGVSFPAMETVEGGTIIPLGGKLQHVKTDGQLVTSIMHPAESIQAKHGWDVDTEGDSLMPNYRSRMTIQQMVDIVAFLQQHYEVVIPEYDPELYYSPYGPLHASGL